MRRLYLILAVWGLCCLPFLSVYAFFDKDVHLLTMQDGLADNSVSSIYKDKDGFMWFGTNNGLSRYDGKAIKNFRTGGTYMTVSGITELSSRCLGVVSEGILFCFDRQEEAFIPVIIKADGTRLMATSILQAGEDRFWVLRGKKLILYKHRLLQEEAGKRTVVEAEAEKEYADIAEKGETFAAFCYSADSTSLCLVSNQGNLLLFRPDAPSSRRRIELFGNQPLTVNKVLDSGGFIWVSTVANGIIRYHLASGRQDRITYGGKGKENLLSHTDVFEIIPLSDHRYLAVTWSGYTLLIPDKEHPEELASEIYNNTASQISRNLETRMLSAYYDPQGVIWIGTNGGGVMYSDLRSQFFNQFHQERHNEICGILLDGERHLWLATFHKGILKSDEPFEPLRRLHFSAVGTEAVRDKETVLCTAKDWKQNLWFGNADGTLTCYDGKKKEFAVCRLSVDGQVNTSSVWALYPDRKHRLWVGTGSELLLFDPASGVCKKIEVGKQLKGVASVYVRAIAGSPDGAVWLGTSNAGLCKVVERRDGSFSVKGGYERKAKLPSLSIRSLLASSDGNIYVGYMDGFAVFSPPADSIRHFYTTHDGLCSNFIGCIVEDGKGRIWLGSNSGMSRYSRHQHLFYNYYIAGSNRSALYSRNMLFFGNNKSLTWFDPDVVDARENNDRVLITGLEVDNRSISIGEKVNGQTVLQEGISYTDSLVLANANRDFSLIFNNLSYSAEQQKYNYRLLPYQKHWLISNDGEKASYTNLPEGEYLFEVKNIYPDGGSGPVTSLKIKILPHWSRTLPFRFLVFAVLIGIIAYLVRLVRIRQRRLEREMQMKHELLTLHLEKEKERQVRMERENFFTSAAHELRTPLTLILSPLQEVLQHMEPDEPLYPKLLAMYQNGSSLHTLVDHLLYVQKIEAGMVRLRLAEVDVVEVVREAARSFVQMAELKGFCFRTDYLEDRLWLWADAEKIASAVRNLLSNAFKYTPAGGTVVLSVGRTRKDGKSYCRIAVSDTGTGIPAELQGRIFDSFITGENNTPAFSTKVGIGLRIVKNTVDLHHGRVTLDSTPGQGSTFVLYLPEGKEHFAGDAYETVAPCRNEDPQKEDELLYKAVEEPAEAPGAKKQILIIEDNPDIRKYIRSLFVRKYTVLEAADGEEGVRVATEKVPDVIVSDIMMPVKDGFACCREIRERQETAHIPLLMLTAKAEDADMLKASRVGADDYMMKPFNPELLRAKVENLILQRERLKRIYTKALMLKQEPAAGGAAEDAFMQQVIHVIEANLSDENFNVKMLAEQLHMSQPTLYRKVKQRSELAVIDMIRSVRVGKAASLIMENRYSIQEISEMVGFSDARTLRKHFTEQFGVSPSKYMEKK